MKIDFIDQGKNFEWGKTSKNYAKYRDIYPKEFYDIILSRNVGIKGQKVLDIGTGTGVLPRNMYKYEATWIGTDIEKNQIEYARKLALENNMNIDFFVSPAEEIDYPENTFDAITACQCIWYPDHKVLAPKVAKMLKPGGKFLILYMGWLPFEDEIAAKTEELILKYNPDWTGCKDTRHHVWIPDEYLNFFNVTFQKEFDVKVPFTRETWHGRIHACRGVDASMKEEDLAKWDKEHKKMLLNNTNETFEILHYVSIAELTLKI